MPPNSSRRRWLSVAALLAVALTCVAIGKAAADFVPSVAADIYRSLTLPPRVDVPGMFIEDHRISDFGRGVGLAALGALLLGPALGVWAISETTVKRQGARHYSDVWHGLSQAGIALQIWCLAVGALGILVVFSEWEYAIDLLGPLLLFAGNVLISVLALRSWLAIQAAVPPRLPPRVVP